MAPFPVAQSLLSPAALAELIASAYDLGRVLDCRLWVANFSDTYRLETERGPFFLRLHRAGWRTGGEVAYELEALRHLAQKGIAVALPVAGKDGAELRVVAAPEGPRQLVLFHPAAGREAYTEPGHPEAFGRSMAALHTAGDSFRSAHPRFAVGLQTLLERPLARIEPELAHRSEEWAYLRRLGDRLWAAVESLPAAQLSWGLCHGDALGSNAHLEGDVAQGTITHFDFDECGPGWRAYDLATFRWIVERRFAPQDAAARWAAYLEGYRQVRDIPPLDLAAVPLLVPVREIWLTGQHARMVAIRGRWLADFDSRLRFLRRWEQQGHLG